MENLSNLKVEKRTVANSRANRRLRASGYVPGNICSKGAETVSITLNSADFQKALNKLGQNTIFKLKLGRKNYNAMVKEIQTEPLTGNFLNVTFQHVSLSEETKADVAFKVEGSDFLGTKQLMVIQNIDTVTVKGLPNDIPNFIDIDVSKMEAGENILIKDITFPDGITTEADPEQLILSVNFKKIYETEEAEETEEETVSVEATATVEEEKAE